MRIAIDRKISFTLINTTFTPINENLVIPQKDARTELTQLIWDRNAAPGLFLLYNHGKSILDHTTHMHLLANIIR